MFDNVLLNIFNRVEEFYSIQSSDVAKWNISWAYDFFKSFKSFSIDFFIKSIINAVEILFEPVNSALL